MVSVLRSILFASLLGCLFFPSLTTAQTSGGGTSVNQTVNQISYSLLAPIGSLTGAPTLSQYFIWFFQFSIAVAGVLAVIRIVWCGFEALSSTNPSARQEASQCVWGALTGLLLALSAWMILAQVSPTLTSANFLVPSLGGSSAGTPLPPPGTPPPPPSTGTTSPGTPGPNQACDLRNMCEQERANNFLCTATSTCAAYSSLAQQMASIGGSGDTLEAIMYLESSCNPSLVTQTPQGQRCGIMQMLPAVANQHKSTCRGFIPECNLLNNSGVRYCQPGFVVDCRYLTQNVPAAVCLAAAEIDANAQNQYCRYDPRFIFAGYKGGAAACLPSTMCANTQGCSGFLTQTWECPYTDPAQQICDTQWQTVRDYVRKGIACLNQKYGLY